MIGLLPIEKGSRRVTHGATSLVGERQKLGRFKENDVHYRASTEPRVLFRAKLDMFNFMMAYGRRMLSCMP